ncbi:TonB-dependent receptor [bacterium AH-315-K03]|nr:TonB-dependent receptor [bacterium AH-315-K03]
MSRKSFHNSRSLRRYPLTDLAVAIALATAVPSIAQSEKSSYTLEEVLVTANKREQNLQEVAASINVVGGEQMKDLAIFDFQQVASVTAGLSLDRVSGNEQAITLRGIKMPAFAIAATTNTVEYYFNEVPQKVTDAYTSLYDIEQIELLRGPQGTLRGRMSPSGAITLTTKRPSYDVFDGYVSVGMSDNNLLNVQGGVSIPVSDTFALRVAGVYDESDDNGVKSVPLGDTSGHENKSARVTALWEPDDSLTVTLIGQYTKENGTFHRGIYGIGTDAAGPGLSGLKIDLEDDRVYNTGKDVSNVTTSVMMAEVEYEFSDHKLTYLTSYQDSEFFDILDLDFTGNGVNTSLDPVASYVGLQAVDRIWDDQGLTQELRIENIDDGIWKYTAGLYYEENDRFYQKALPLTPVRDTFLAPIEETNNTITDVALFTNHVVQLSQAGTIEAGVRYTEREIAPKAGGAVNFYSFTGNASFKYQFTDELMAYVSVGTSFRPGSGGTATSTSGYVDPTELNWESEDSISYEVGVKGSLFDGKVDYSLAAFQQQFTNFANSTFRIACTGAPTTDGTLGFATSDGGATSVGCTEDITYGGDAISQGIELESRALLTQDWFIQVNASYAKADCIKPTSKFNKQKNYVSCAMVFFKIPTGPISTSIVSPGFIHTGGVRLAPTPPGVPVAITSPGFKGVKAEI